jgi:hypothetical protein
VSPTLNLAMARLTQPQGANPAAWREPQPANRSADRGCRPGSIAAPAGARATRVAQAQPEAARPELRERAATRKLERTGNHADPPGAQRLRIAPRERSGPARRCEGWPGDSKWRRRSSAYNAYQAWL